jgi:hypothetical protein
MGIIPGQGTQKLNFEQVMWLHLDMPSFSKSFEVFFLTFQLSLSF